SCAILASGAVVGTKMMMFSPTDAPTPASAAAAFPVLAVLMVVIPCSIARATTSALALSLSDPVGFCPSSLTQTCFNSNSAAASIRHATAAHLTLVQLAAMPYNATLTAHHYAAPLDPVALSAPHNRTALPTSPLHHNRGRYIARHPAHNVGHKLDNAAQESEPLFTLCLLGG